MHLKIKDSKYFENINFKMHKSVKKEKKKKRRFLSAIFHQCMCMYYFVLATQIVYWPKLKQLTAENKYQTIYDRPEDLPSNSSKLAPPPVETWLTLSSVPNLAAHVAVSPPP